MTEAGDVVPPGTRLEEFEIERYLNAGGFGVTYLAQDLSLDARRVVKEYLPREWGTRRQDGTVGPRTGGDEKDYEWAFSVSSTRRACWRGSGTRTSCTCTG